MKSQMTIGRKISLTCVFLLAFTVVLGSVALVSMGRMESATQAIIVDSLPGVYVSSRAEGIAKDMRGTMLMHVGSEKEDDRVQIESTIAQLHQKVGEILKDYEKTITRARGRELYEKVGPALDRVMASWEKPRALSRAGKSQEALAAFRSETWPVFNDYVKTIADVIEYNKTSGDEFSQQASSAASTARFWTWTILLLAATTGSGLAFLLVRSLNRALGQAVSELSQGAQQLASAASQVSSSSQSLAQGASEQAASLEETSASSEEITSMARKNTENSRSAADLVSSSQEKFVGANQSLEQTVVAMGEINAQSGKISKIIKVIDEIAFQTNILALNAAVEAARAGEAGMGFAVVADEVRNLAQRCAQAARDTSALIEESIAKSNDGKTKVDEVAVAIRAVTAQADKIKTMVDEVNVGSQEQARGMEQIGKAIIQMEQVTQRSAASSEECASASEELTAQADALREIVTRLTTLVGGGDGSVGAGAASSRNRATTAPMAHRDSSRDAAAHQPADHAPEPASAGAVKDSFPLD